LSVLPTIVPPRINTRNRTWVGRTKCPCTPETQGEYPFCLESEERPNGLKILPGSRNQYQRLRTSLGQERYAGQMKLGGHAPSCEHIRSSEKWHGCGLERSLFVEEFGPCLSEKPHPQGRGKGCQISQTPVQGQSGTQR